MADPKAISATDRVVATKRQVSCTVEGEAVILHLDDGTYYGLNDVGTRVWQLLQEPHTLSELVAGIVAEFEVEPQHCEADLQELLGSLAERGLLELTEA